MLFIVFMIITNISLVNAKTTYLNYSNIYKIEKEYSYSTLYMSKNTEFKVIKDTGNNSSQNHNYMLYRTNIKKNNELIVLITNSAVNKNGELLDAVVKINNVNNFASGEDGFVTFGIKKDFKVTKTVGNTAPSETYTINYNEPLVFELGSSKAQADLTIIYYKAGTYMSENEKGTLGEITALSGSIYGFDNIADGNYASDLFAGKEGIIPLNGDSIIYYNKSKIHKKSDYKIEYKEQDNGIAIETKNGENSDVLHYENTVFLKNNHLTNSTFKLSFSGATGNLYLAFISPYPYNLDLPTQSAEVKDALIGSEFNYIRTQYVPNNYYGTILAFQGAYDNMYVDSRYNSFKLTETLNNNLEVNIDKIRILNELNEDVTEYFETSINNNQLTIQLKNEVFTKSAFYGHFYTISIPVKLNSDIKNLDKITTTTTRTTTSTCKTYTNCPKEETLSNKKNDVKLKYKLVVNYYEKGTNNKLAESKENTYYLNDEYKTDYNVVDKNWDVTEIPKNASGKINSNIEINYYFTPVVIENPPTGMLVIPFGLIILVVSIVIIFKINKRKIFNI